jgi:L-ascorbate metabolism protein UlaG (beta-lactamase superfamily)
MLLPPKKLVTAGGGDKFRIGEVIIKTHMCRHPAAVTPVTYLITSEDGVNVWHTADSSPYPEMAQIGKETEIDVVFCSVGIAQGVSAESGSEIAWLTKPKVVCPIIPTRLKARNSLLKSSKRSFRKQRVLSQK